RIADTRRQRGAHADGDPVIVTPDTLYWDPYDTEIDADPHPIWKRMRDERPVYRNERYDFWALSRHDDIAAVHPDSAPFPSSRAPALELGGTARGARGSIILKAPPIHTILRS